jgi:hypothetical protein
MLAPIFKVCLHDFTQQNRSIHEVATEFVTGRPNDRIGLVLFGGAAAMLLPPIMQY